MIFFFYFFQNFLARFAYERNSEQNFFFLFLGLSQPVLAKNNAGKRFFNFFAIFFEIFLHGSSMNEIRDKIFFLSFPAYLIPFWLKIKQEWGFLVFSIFFLFSSEFSSTGLVWTEFRTKIYFPSFSVCLIPFRLKLMPKRGFLIFSIFLLFFSEFSSPGWVWTKIGTKFFFSLFFGLSTPGLG